MIRKVPDSNVTDDLHPGTLSLEHIQFTAETVMCKTLETLETRMLFALDQPQRIKVEMS